MALTRLNAPFPVFTDTDGSALDAGFVYVGVENENPETSPITVYYDIALTQAAAQPLRTLNGYIMRNGAPADLYANSEYSLTVRNSRGALIITSPSSAGASTGVALEASNNLSDVDNAATSLANLGLTATAAEINKLDGLNASRTELDYTVGVTSAIQTQINTKAPAASPTFTGVPAAPTASPGTNTTQLATTAFVEAATGSLSSGALTFIATADAAGDATIDFTAFDAATYDAYMFVFSNVVPATDNASLYARTSTDGGSTYDSGASDYDYILNGASPVTAANINLAINIGSASGEDGYSGTVTLCGPHIATDRTRLTALACFQNLSGSLEEAVAFGQRNSAADVDAIRFLFSSGNIESGTITMYGMRNA